MGVKADERIQKIRDKMKKQKPKEAKTESGE